MDKRVEYNLCERHLRHIGSSVDRQCSRSARGFCLLDRQERQPMALWRRGRPGRSETPPGTTTLWEFNTTAKTWTWVSGSDTGNTQGVYGTLGVAAASNVPGSRAYAQSWTDQSGNLWLFSGLSLESTQPQPGGLNDFWEFGITNKEWMWMGGGDTDNSIQPGIYGMLGVASATNAPGERSMSIGWDRQ